MMESGSNILYFPNLESLEAVMGYKRIVTSLQMALPNHDIEGYFQRKPMLLAQANHLAVAFDRSPDEPDSAVIGLIAIRNYASQNAAPAFIHISTLHVAENQHKSLLLMRMIATIYIAMWQQEGKLPTWTAIKTFNPSVYNVLLRLQRIIGNGALLYPAFTENNTNYEDEQPPKEVVKHIAVRLEPECLFNIATGAIQGGGGSVGGSYWPTPPRSSHLEINQFFDERLAPTDRMLCVLGLNDQSSKRAAINLLTRWIAKANEPRLYC